MALPERGLELQDLLEYLKSEFNRQMQPDLAGGASCEEFVAWARGFLIQNPPSTINPAGYGNAAIQLTNGVVVALSPMKADMVAGTMAPVMPGSVVRVTGVQRERPKGTTDMTTPGAAVDRTKTEPTKRFDT